MNGQKTTAAERAGPVVRVTVQPLGRRVEVGNGTALLAAIRVAGPELVTVCGGRGLCGTCKVIAPGRGFTPPTEQERELLPPAELSAGVRLACQATVVADAWVDVPPESLTAPSVLSSRAAARACQRSTPLS